MKEYAFLFCRTAVLILKNSLCVTLLFTINGMNYAVTRNNIVFAHPYTTIDYTLVEMAVPYSGTDGFVLMIEIFMMPGKSYY